MEVIKVQHTSEVSEGLENLLTELIINCTNQAIKSQHSISKEWFSLSEAAKYAGVSNNTLVKFRQLGLKVTKSMESNGLQKKKLIAF